MKGLLGNILLAAFFIFALAKGINDFIADGGIHYFSQQPHRFLFVAVIAIAGGLIAFGFSALWRRLQREIKLAVLAAGGSFFTAVGAYVSIQFVIWQARVDPAGPRQIPWVLVLPALVVASLLWIGFCLVLKSRNRAA
jgi:hypothetical protein